MYDLKDVTKIYELATEFFKQLQNFYWDTVKSYFKALGLYNFIMGFGWAYKWGGGGLISGWAYKQNEKNCSERRDKAYLRNGLKLTYHYILSYIYNT